MDWFFNFMTSLYNLVGFAMVAIVVFAIAFSVYLRYRMVRLAEQLEGCLNKILEATDSDDVVKVKAAQLSLDEYRENTKKLFDLLERTSKK